MCSTCALFITKKFCTVRRKSLKLVLTWGTKTVFCALSWDFPLFKLSAFFFSPLIVQVSRQLSPVSLVSYSLRASYLLSCLRLSRNFEKPWTVVSLCSVTCLVHLQIALPADAKRKNTKVCEEVVVPPNTPLPPKEGEAPIPISSLDEASIWWNFYVTTCFSQLKERNPGVGPRLSDLCCANFPFFSQSDHATKVIALIIGFMTVMGTLANLRVFF